VRRRLERHGGSIDDVRFDLQGMDSLFGDRLRGGYPTEVRLRMGLRTADLDVARAAVHEMELLYFGPAGGGGAVGSVVPAVGVTPAYVPRELIPLDVEVVTA